MAGIGCSPRFTMAAKDIGYLQLRPQHCHARLTGSAENTGDRQTSAGTPPAAARADRHTRVGQGGAAAADLTARRAEGVPKAPSCRVAGKHRRSPNRRRLSPPRIDHFRQSYRARARGRRLRAPPARSRRRAGGSAGAAGGRVDHFRKSYRAREGAPVAGGARRTGAAACRGRRAGGLAGKAGLARNDGVPPS
jgi:hypothetical protein